MTRKTFDVVVVGGGVIGLSVAWRAGRDGHAVAVCDPSPAGGASWVAAGMLAPTTEARWGEPDLFRLAQHSTHAWPDFAAELQDQSGLAVGLRREGTLSVALDPDDLRQMSEAAQVQEEFGCRVERLSVRDCRELEPALNPRIVGGILNLDDHQVDNRALLRALLLANEALGVTLVRTEVRKVVSDPTGRVNGVELDSGDRLGAGTVVLAAGCHSGGIGGLPVEVPVRPVKGQILRLSTDPAQPVLNRTVRAVAQGRSVYLVPRVSGEVVVGATVEELGFDTSVTAGAVYDLLRSAAGVVPDIVEARLAEAVAGLRPGSPDNGPLLGPTSAPGMWLATGHFRHGIMLAPSTAEAMRASLAGEAWPEPAEAFRAARFAGVLSS